MDIFAGLQGHLNTVFLNTVPFLFVLTVIIFFHELGHFAVARWCGVKVDAFSIGFGREIFGRTDSQGTRWKLCWIPLGGYVKFFDDSDVSSSPGSQDQAENALSASEGGFHGKPLGQRAAIVAAGPIANFILAIVIFAGIFTFVGRPVSPPRVDDIKPGSAAELAGFEIGDIIVEIDGESIKAFADLQRKVSISPDQSLTFVVDRGGENVTLSATPLLNESKDRFGNSYRRGLLGISHKMKPGDVVVEKYNILEATWMGTKETWFVVERTFSFFGGLIGGTEKADQLGGPLRIAQVSGQLASISITALVNLAAVLSVSIGLLNLFPIPVLDGGHLLYYGIEAIRGKPLSDRVLQAGFKFGLAAVLMLMIFATWNDLMQFAN